LKFKRNLTNEETLTDKNLEKELVKISENLFKIKTSPALLFAKEIGNMYTPSLYSCLISHLLSKPIDDLIDSRICLFSYGSGSASAMFSILVNNNKNNDRFSLGKILENLNNQKERMLKQRVEIEPSLYDVYLQNRELTNKQVPRESKSNPNALYPGTWYLKSVDSMYRRYYERRTIENHAEFDLETARKKLSEELSSLL
jgi:hydroxymethylglutaryl-CoA synthase